MWCCVLWETVVAGPLVRVEIVFGETQEEHLSGIRWNVVTCGRYGRRRDRAMSKLNGCAQFSDQILLFGLSVWFPLSRGSGPAFDVSAAWPAFCCRRS